MNQIFEKSRGQVMVLYSIAFAFALCGAIAMGTDVAVMYVNWQHSQKTVDAAALAGANYLPGGITYSNPLTGLRTPFPQAVQARRPAQLQRRLHHKSPALMRSRTDCPPVM